MELTLDSSARRRPRAWLWFAPLLAVFPAALVIWCRGQGLESDVLIGLAILTLVYGLWVAIRELRISGYRGWKLRLLAVPLALLIALPNLLLGMPVLGLASFLITGD